MRIEKEKEIARDQLKKQGFEILKKYRALPDSENVPTSDTICINTVTTGTNQYTYIDELLRIVILNEDGEVLYNERFSPLFYFSGKEDCQNNKNELRSNAEAIPELKTILKKAKKIIGYDLYFELEILEHLIGENVLSENCKEEDVMRLFAPIYGDYSPYYGNYRWQCLATCASYYNYEWDEDNFMTCIENTKAILFCYKKIMQDLENYEK